MAEKNFFQDKWLKDQYNERNPGQRNHPDSRHVERTLTPPSPPEPVVTNPLPEDKDEQIEILRQLLSESWTLLCNASLSGQPVEANTRRFLALDKALRSRGIIGPGAPKPRVRQKKK